MNVAVVTQVRLLGEGIAACLAGHQDISMQAVAPDLATLRKLLRSNVMDVVLIDVTLGVQHDDVRSVAVEWPQVPLVALGLREQRQDVIRCGRAGFLGYVVRDATLAELCTALPDVIAGRLACNAEISGGLLRVLFRAEAPTEPSLRKH